MVEKKFEIKFQEFKSPDEMIPEDRELVSAAIEAMSSAYAPYSHFHVGAAVRMSNAQIVRGSNQENAAFPSGLCAERTAMFSAHSKYPDKNMVSIALAGGVHGKLAQNPVAPCGACRQVMAQYQTKAGAPVSVIMVGKSKIYKFGRVDDILPLIFDNI